jgi:hypothetical protein
LFFFGSIVERREVKILNKKNCIKIKVKTKSLRVLLVSVLLLFALAGVQFVGKVHAAGYIEYTGILDDADFVARFPETWNGMLVIYCRSYAFGTISAVAALDGINSLSNGSVSELLNQGFAVAASSYGAIGYCIQKGMDTTYALTNYLVSTYHVTGKVFLWDVSMSGPVGLLLGEKYPNIYSGVLDIVGIKDLKEQYWIVPAAQRPELEAETGGTPTTQPKAYEDRSPTYHANIAIPVITVHGTSDVTVPFNQSIMYQTAVANAGHANLYRLYNVTGAYHLSTSIYSQVPARFAELVAWSDALTASTASMWDKTYGGTGDDTGTGDTVQTSDGGFAISGDTDSFGAGGLDFWLIKTDADGNMEWNKTYGGALDEVTGGMCQTNDGGYAISGYTTSFGTGGQDFYLVRTDADGKAYWAKTYGGIGDEYAMTVVQTLDGGYAMLGVTDSFGAGGQDFYFVKTDASGNMQWSKTYGGNGTDYGYTVVQTSDGGYTLAGQTTSFGAGSNDFWLIKTDASGNMLWNKTYGGNGTDAAQNMVKSSDEGYAIVGYTASFGGFKAYLVKVDADGNMQWNKTYSTEVADIGIHVIQTADGGYAMVGWNYANGQDFLLIKTDADGNLQWNMTYGGTGVENGYALLQTSDGGYVLTGNTNSFGAGGNDIWLVKTDALGVIPEGLTVEVMLILSAFAVIVGVRYFRKRPKWQKW